MKLEDILIIGGVVLVPLLVGIFFAVAALESAKERWELVVLSIASFAVAAALGLITTGIRRRRATKT